MKGLLCASTARFHRFWPMLLLGLASVLPLPRESWGAEDPLNAPSGWITRRLLDSLDPGLREARTAVVCDSLTKCPGSRETFLLVLLGEGFLRSLWSAPAGFLGPLDPPLAGGYNNRGYGILGAPEPLPPMEHSGAMLEAQQLMYTSPLLLDMNLDGAAGVPGGRWEPHPGIDLAGIPLAVFDINGDGYEEMTEWVDGTDGLLSESPRPASGRDLFGIAEGWADGFRKLALRDADRDGLVSGEELKGLYVWTDANRDAVCQDGECLAATDLGIDALVLPAAALGTLPVGSFRKGKTEGALWDWWPSYALAHLRAASDTDGIPTSLDLQPRPWTVGKITAPMDLPVEPSGRIPRQALEAAGMDWESLHLVQLAPDGSWLILQDRQSDPARIASGSAVGLWVFSSPKGNSHLRVFPVPLAASSLQQFVFGSTKSALAVADSGSRLLRLDLETGDQEVLQEFQAGADGFRAGERAWRSGGQVLVTGYFHDGGRRMARKGIAEARGGAAGPSLATLTDLESQRAAVGALGSIAMEVLVSERLGFYMVLTAGGDMAVASCLDGVAREIDRPVRPGVLAARGNRVLYLKVSPPILPRLLVHDIGTGASFHLGSGEFCYPYLEDGGRVAVAATIDWSTGAMTFLAGDVEDGVELRKFLELPSIGALRVSDDGLRFAALGPEGLDLGALPVAPRFIRGNANGSEVSADPSQAVDISDGIHLLGFLFLGGPTPPCLDAADVNDDGALDISDVISILYFLFGGDGGAPGMQPPWSVVGPDLTADALGCEG